MEKKICSAKRGSCDGWKDDGKKMYNDLVKKIEKLRKNPDTGSEFEHKLMVKWLIEKKKSGRRKYEWGELQHLCGGR